MKTLSLMRMTSILVFSMLVTLLATSCSPPAVTPATLKPGGSFSPAERRSLAEIHPDLSGWTPTHSAVWEKDGTTTQVYLRDGMIGSLSMPYDVFVFDSAGRVMEANLIQAPNPATPEVVTCVAPLKVAYRTADGRRVEVGVKYSQEVARSKVLEKAELSQRLEIARDKWMKSGSTNNQELFDMLKQAWPKP